MISWFARNPVAANLLMVVILIGGWFSASHMRSEGFPAMPPKTVTVTVVNESGSPEDNEQAIALKIEEALRGVVGIKRLTSTSTADEVTVRVRKASGQDLQQLAETIRSKVNTVSLPSRAERPVFDTERWEELVASVQVTGDVDVDILRQVAQQVRSRLRADPLIPYVTTGGMRTPEISITVRDDVLQAYDLTLKDVADRVGAFSKSFGSGELSQNGRSLTVKADQKAYYLRDFANIEIITRPDGSSVRLRDLATVRDGFTEYRVVSRFQGQPSIGLYVQMIGKADLIAAAKRTREIVSEIQRKGSLPAGVSLDVWNDASGYISDRLSLLASNAAMGVGLVFVFLALFLNLRIAFWVAMGLPVAFAGAFILMGDLVMGITINELSTFGFIVALGIVVDDAVVVGESIYAARQQAVKDGALDQTGATLLGVHRVAVPTVFGVLTTIAAFLPITFIDGELAEIFAIFAWVVVFALIFSIVESKLILPAHLAAIPLEEGQSFFGRAWKRVQRRFGKVMTFLNEGVYRGVLKWAVAYRYAALFGFVAVLIMVLGMVQTGRLRTVMFPEIPSDTIMVTYDVVPGLDSRRMFAEADRIERAAREIDQALCEKYGRTKPLIVRLETIATEGSGALLTAELAPRSSRKVGTAEIAREWREAVGDVEGADKLDFAASWEGEEDFRISLISQNKYQLQQASEALATELRGMPGVSDIRNSVKSTVPRVQLELLDSAKAMGLTIQTVADQLYGGLAGYEVQRIQRGEDEVKVRVRLPKSERSDVSALQTLNIRTPQGDVLPLSAVARFVPGHAPDSITRVNYQRVAVITADTDKSVTSGREIVDTLQYGFFPDLRAAYPGLSIRIGGEVEEEAKIQREFITAFAIALVAIYALLAIPLKSYTQPLLIMAAIPFGVVGAFLGHWLNDLPLSILSINGILALSGVVVNDSLLLVGAYNHYREQGLPLRQAVLQAGRTRFRAVILTSVTTFAGLAPLITETSEQAQVLIPAAVSLGYGVMFATAITLVLIPVLICIMDDVRKYLSPVDETAIRLAPQEGGQ